jgi:crotonobetainyl-CoA:carnitine CoA-transferase CaiB-like acyl-CoA transferase
VFELLEGVRVLEFAKLLNGGDIGRMFGDLGADVIKVEQPGAGDSLRRYYGEIIPDHSPMHLNGNRNKRSVTINVRTDAGREVFFDLLRTADVFIDGLSAGACDRLGVGYEAQRAVKPDIIYAQCSGFGNAGPYARIPTHGGMMVAAAGKVEVQMSDDGFVRQTGGSFGPGSGPAAVHTALTAVAALSYKARTGRGVYIDGAGTDATMATGWVPLVQAWNRHRVADPPTAAAASGRGGARYQFYETKDKKYILFCATEHKFWRNFCRAVDRGDLLGDGKRDDATEFGDDDLRRELQPVFHTRTREEWLDFSQQHDVPIGPVNSAEEALEDPQLRSREIIYDAVHPVAGEHTVVGWATCISGQSFGIFRPAPELGQHTDEVLGELGYDQAQRESLRADGTV